MTTLKQLDRNTLALANTVAPRRAGKFYLGKGRLKNWIGAIAGLAALAVLTPASAQTQYVYGSMDFTAGNQSMWDSSNPYGASFTYSLTKSWNPGNINKDSYKSVPVLGKFGGEVDAGTIGSAGINLYATVTSGAVNVDYKVSGGIGLPTSVQAGHSFNIVSGWTGQGGTLSTQSPQFSVGAGSTIDAISKVTLKAQAFSKEVFNKGFSSTMKKEVPLFSFNNQSINGSFNLMDILTGSGHVPMINTNGQGWGSNLNAGQTLTSSGSDNFVTLNGDFTKLMTTFLGLPSLKYDDSQDVNWAGSDWGSIDYGYNFLDLYGTLSLIAAQDFSFSATPIATITFTCGSNAPYVVNVPLGTTYTATLPSSFIGPVNVATTVNIATNTMTNNTKLIVNPGLSFLPMEAHVGGSVASHDVATEDFAPIPTISLVDAAFPISVYSKNFTLKGFQPRTLSNATITVTP